MKRNALIRYLSSNGCELVSEGGRHSIWKNRYTGDMIVIPRHNEIKELIVQKICRDLKDLPETAIQIGETMAKIALLLGS